MRQSRGAELRGDVLVLSQTFEGHVDILDNIIEVRSSTISAKDASPISFLSTLDENPEASCHFPPADSGP